jgi:hypothetical protein
MLVEKNVRILGDDSETDGFRPLRPIWQLRSPLFSGRKATSSQQFPTSTAFGKLRQLSDHQSDSTEPA